MYLYYIILSFQCKERVDIMAQITKRKSGYLIRVSCGYSADGTKQITQSMTWHPPKPNMSEKAIEKALNKAAVEFEQKCAGGQTVVNSDKFENFCEEWFNVYAERTLKQSTILLYKQLRTRVYSQLGHLRLDKITPMDIDKFISWLSKQSKEHSDTAVCKVDFKALLKTHGYSQKGFAQEAGLCYQTIKNCFRHNAIKWESAVKISEALKEKPEKLFKRIPNKKRLSSKTVKNYVSFISSVFDYAVHTKQIKENPCRNCTLPKINEPEHKMFTIEQAQQFLDILQNAPLKYQAFFTLAIYGGFRRGEILGLEWNDIDFDKRLIHIERTVHYNAKVGYYDTPPKSKSSIRALMLPAHVIDLLKSLQNEQISQRLKLGDKWNNTDRVFTTWDGHQMSGSAPYNFLKRTCEANNLPQVSLHSFRHLNASLLIHSGVNPKTVQNCLGHSQASTTLNIYAHDFQEAEAQALGAVADILDGKKQLNTKAE